MNDMMDEDTGEVVSTIAWEAIRLISEVNQTVGSRPFAHQRKRSFRFLEEGKI